MSEDLGTGNKRVIWANCPEMNKGFASNRVVTTKYNLVTFFPFSLFIQFRRVSNIYFLITAVLQSIPQISPLQPFTAIAPLVFVLAVSMIREGVEDYLRYKSDKEINTSPTMVYQAGLFREIFFEKIQVGDVVLVKKDQVFPCDIVMLSNSNENGTAFIETSSLDGEKALKTRQAFIQTAFLYTSVSKIRVSNKLECELPNARLYNYSGTYEFKGVKYPLDKSNLLLAGAFLRNTEWAIGISVYTGGDTKLRQNMMGRKYKESQVERMANRYIMFIIFLQFCLCFTAAVASGVWVSKNIHAHSYIRYDPSYSIYDQGGAQGVLSYFTYFLLLNTMLPISLIISMELIKMFQGFFMMLDQNMYSEKRDRRCKVSSFSLNEELGMIKHIFSDKTGTLTCNQMEFKFFCTGNRIYGNQSSLLNLGLRTHVTFEDREIKYTFDDKNIENDLYAKEEIMLKFPIKVEVGDEDLQILTQREITKMMLKCMALCHECIVEREDEIIKYTGPSPDDVVLVDAARRLGFTLTLIKSEVMTLEISSTLMNDDKFTEEYQRVCILEFNSDRKRMSVVVKEKKTGRYLIFMKGADNVMLKLLSSENSPKYIELAKGYVEAFSKRGFRTLLMSFKYISKKEFKLWKKLYDQAITQIEGREEEVGRVAAEIEKDMFLIGCTAVEDSLQDDVPETINDLMKAGLSLWMLTGDKLETAENIGKTCTLIDDNMHVEKCSAVTAKSCCERLEDARSKFKENSHLKQLALIIEGSSLQVVLYDEKNPSKREKHPEISMNRDNIDYANRCKEIFLEVADMCKTIICCRVSPGEKQEVVKLIKNNTDKITLSIGDGANDVPMILEAHIGVGLYGEEGIQAVQASDYALGEFRYLWELLLIHGRFNYIRQSELILYFFYKNLVFTIPQFFFAFYCAYSGQTVFDDWYLTFYNLVFTALPLFMRAIFERDFEVPRRFESIGEGVSDEKKQLRKKIPLAYSIGSENQLFTFKRFLIWVANGFYHAAIIFFISLYASEEGIVSESGHVYDQWSFSISAFSSILLIVNLKLAINTKLWNNFSYLCMIGLSIVLYFIFILIYDDVTYTPSFHTVYMLLGTHYFYFCMFVNVGIVCVTDVALTIIGKTYFPNSSDILAKQTIQSKSLAKKNHDKNNEKGTVEVSPHELNFQEDQESLHLENNDGSYIQPQNSNASSPERSKVTHSDKKRKKNEKNKLEDYPDNRS